MHGGGGRQGYVAPTPQHPQHAPLTLPHPHPPTQPTAPQATTLRTWASPPAQRQGKTNATNRLSFLLDRLAPLCCPRSSAQPHARTPRCPDLLSLPLPTSPCLPPPGRTPPGPPSTPCSAACPAPTTLPSVSDKGVGRWPLDRDKSCALLRAGGWRAASGQASVCTAVADAAAADAASTHASPRPPP